MVRYIDVDALIKEIILLCQLAQKRVRDTHSNNPVYERYITQLQDRERILRIINAQPTADVVPKSNGKWKPYKDYFTHRQIGWICSNCTSVIHDVSNGDTDYCPHCGAVMETEREEET